MGGIRLTRSFEAASLSASIRFPSSARSAAQNVRPRCSSAAVASSTRSTAVWAPSQLTSSLSSLQTARNGLVTDGGGKWASTACRRTRRTSSARPETRTDKSGSRTPSSPGGLGASSKEIERPGDVHDSRRRSGPRCNDRFSTSELGEVGLHQRLATITTGASSAIEKSILGTGRGACCSTADVEERSAVAGIRTHVPREEHLFVGRVRRSRRSTRA